MLNFKLLPSWEVERLVKWLKIICNYTEYTRSTMICLIKIHWSCLRLHKILYPRHFTFCYCVFTSILSWKEWLGSEASKASPAKISRVPTHQIRERDSPNTNQPAAAYNIYVFWVSQNLFGYRKEDKPTTLLLWATGRGSRAKLCCYFRSAWW